MMEFNFWPLIVAPFASLLVGAVWYNPKVFGNIWMRETGVQPPKEGERPNMFKVFGLCLVYSFFISWFLYGVVIHQMGAFQATVNIGGDPAILENYMKVYGGTYRTFKHGAFHGSMTGLLFALPVVGVGSLFENRSFKYVLVSGGYWVVTCALMGGIICAWK